MPALRAQGDSPGTDDAPQGWFHAGSNPGDYAMGADHSVTHFGHGSGYIRSKTATPGGFGTLMQTFKADNYHGKRVRLSAWVKANQVADWSGVWMRVDGPDSRQSLAFDNMQSRPIKGTQAWTRHDVVLDVAPEATNIAFGILLHGAGQVWMDDVHIDVVDANVPTTGVAMNEGVRAMPENLDFERQKPETNDR